MKKIVVLFGSFNPVSKAHFMLLQHACDYIGAEKGLFVASSESYLNKKTGLKNVTPFVLDGDTRKSMLESLTNDDQRLSFWGFEMGGVTPDSTKTFKKIIKTYPDYQVYCLCGADKVKSIHKWPLVETLLPEIEFLVYNRNDIDINKVIEKDKILSKYKDKFNLMENVNEVENISSTLIRDMFFKEEDYSSLMNVGPYNILKKYKPSDFKDTTFEDEIVSLIKYGGRYIGEKVREKIYLKNTEMFNNWDEYKDILGEKSKRINNSKVYSKEFKVISQSNYNTEFDCFNDDTVDVAYGLIIDGYNPAILNLASNYRPCGGYDDKKSSQEESLCHSSTLSQSLYQYGNPDARGVKESGLTNLVSGVYPLDINFGGIYSSNVCFFRNNKSKYYTIKEKPFDCSVITVASLSNRKTDKYINQEAIYFNNDGTLTANGLEIEKNKIRTIYRIGLENNHDSLVLGAFGCGVFNLIPSEVAQLFLDVLNEDEFKNKYKKIVFAILESRKRGALVEEKGKFKPFYDLYKNR
jgi:nicotinate (nicotinamide) nucleotide adenylyltransferase